MLTGVYTVEFSGRIAEPARRNTTTSASPRAGQLASAEHAARGNIVDERNLRQAIKATTEPVASPPTSQKKR
jgi:hypothetical protein